MVGSRTVTRTSVVLVLVAALGGGRSFADPGDAVQRAGIRNAVEELSACAKVVNQAFKPFRRGAPPEPTAWARLDDLQRATTQVAAAADTLLRRVDELSATAGFRPEVGAGEFRRRLALADSLAVRARESGHADWRAKLPADPEDARLMVGALAREAKALAHRSTAAATGVAYAVGVTEGVGRSALGLSAVGVAVTFTVLAVIAAVVGSLRRLDDRWQRQEQREAQAATAKQQTIDDTTLVLIAAACATVIVGRHRIRRVRRLLSPTTKRTPWSAQGRLILQGSHTVGSQQN